MILKKGKLAKAFLPVWWLRNRHIQSCFNAFFPPRARSIITWEQLELPDGDFLDLCWAGPEEGPIMVLLHGLEGSVNSHYIQLMLDAFVEANWRVVVLHFRSCSGRLNRLPKSYHAGETDDLCYLINVLRLRYPNRIISSVGFSIGGNVLLHYLVQYQDNPLRCAVAVSVPFELKKCADYLPKFYQWALLRTMKQKALGKIERGYKMPVTQHELKRIYTFRSFDDAVTAPLHGFSSGYDYYERMTIRPWLSKIIHPTLIIHAIDDPLVPISCVPDQSELARSVVLESLQTGGHIGFVEGVFPWALKYWLKDRILAFLKASQS